MTTIALKNTPKNKSACETLNFCASCLLWNWRIWRKKNPKPSKNPHLTSLSFAPVTPKKHIQLAQNWRKSPTSGRGVELTAPVAPVRMRPTTHIQLAHQLAQLYSKPVLSGAETKISGDYGHD